MNLKTKIQLHQQCIELVGNRINSLKTAIQEAQDAANNETKSSAGDKHETGRAMAQLETEKLTSQLSEALKLEQVLNKINPEENHKKIGLGTLVQTNNGIFYIAVSLGKIESYNTSYYAISAVSPIGKELLGLTKNARFTFNNTSYSVESIT